MRIGWRWFCTLRHRMILDTLDWDGVSRFLALSVLLTFAILCSIVEPRARNPEYGTTDLIVEPNGAVA
jgi:hypothetical protein